MGKWMGVFHARQLLFYMHYGMENMNYSVRNFDCWACKFDEQVLKHTVMGVCCFSIYEYDGHSTNFYYQLAEFYCWISIIVNWLVLLNSLNGHRLDSGMLSTEYSLQAAAWNSTPKHRASGWWEQKCSLMSKKSMVIHFCRQIVRAHICIINMQKYTCAAPGRLQITIEGSPYNAAFHNNE